MRRVLGPILLTVGLSVFALAYGYSTSCNSAQDRCVVTCDNGERAGVMYWNGTQWSDGVRSSTDKDDLAKKIVGAQGSACR